MEDGVAAAEAATEEARAVAVEAGEVRCELLAHDSAPLRMQCTVSYPT